jgi:putative serine protease PepD
MRLPRPLLPLAAAAVLGGSVGAVATDALHSESQAAPAPVVAGRTIAATTSGLSPHDVYAEAKDSVAYITAQITQASNGPFGQTEQGTATGSGFVVSSDGYVVTNNHVIDGASSVTVKIGDGKTLTAKVVGTDPSTDLALLKVDASGLKPLTLGDSSAVQVGDPAYAIGNPYGLDRTLTTGVISALQRQISAPNGYTIDNVLQTDAAINPGNSGGPLFNTAGQVIGVNSQIESSGSSSGGEGGNVGIGFAIPSNTVKTVVDQLMKSGKVSHAYLGIQTQDVSGGAGVASLAAGGPAASAGLQQGDVITSLGGKAVADSTALLAQVDAHRPGETVAVTVQRNGQSKTIQVKLGNRPATTSADSATQAQQGQDQVPQQGDGTGQGSGW